MNHIHRSQGLHVIMFNIIIAYIYTDIFVHLSIYPSIYLSIHPSIYTYLTYLYLSIPIYIYLYLSISVYISIYFYLSLSISIYLYLSLSISIYLYLSLSISIYFYLSTYKYKQPVPAETGAGKWSPGHVRFQWHCHTGEDWVCHFRASYTVVDVGNMMQTPKVKEWVPYLQSTNVWPSELDGKSGGHDFLSSGFLRYITVWWLVDDAPTKPGHVGSGGNGGRVLLIQIIVTHPNRSHFDLWRVQHCVLSHPFFVGDMFPLWDIYIYIYIGSSL